MTPTESEKGFISRMSDRVSCRQVLNLMVILGFMFNYMLRVNLTIAIVDMVAPALPDITNGNASIENGNVTIENLGRIMENSTSLDIQNHNATSFENVLTTSGTKYHWNKYEQNYILGCFFWGYVLTELPGGRLAEVIGARRVFGYSMLAASLITLLIPIACDLSIYAVILLRILLGLFLGATWPAMPPMAAKWIPPMERSKFIANMMASSLGAAITMPVCGFLIYNLGWPSVFYITGVIGLLWSIAWFLVVFDSPADHPRITTEEREFIESSIEKGAGGGKNSKPSRVPWGQILTSGPVWAIVVTHGCSVFGYFTVVNQLPTFMKDVFHFNIKENGLLSSLPYFGKYIMAVLASWLADYLRRTGKLSTTATRKIFTTFAVFLPGLLMVAQAQLGTSAPFSVAIFTLALTINGAVTAGYLANALDIAPNFSGTIFGMANTLSSIGGFMSAFMVAALTNEDNSFGQWKFVFWILAGIYCFGGYHYLMLGSGLLQPWNSVKPQPWANDEKPDDELPESVPLTAQDKQAVP